MDLHGTLRNPSRRLRRNGTAGYIRHFGCIGSGSDGNGCDKSGRYED